MPRGIFRDGSFAHVAYDDNVTVPISRSLYATRGYQPPFEALPARHEPAGVTADPPANTTSGMSKLRLRW